MKAEGVNLRIGISQEMDKPYDPSSADQARAGAPLGLDERNEDAAADVRC
jgi:hypothetical protein